MCYSIKTKRQLQSVCTRAPCDIARGPLITIYNILQKLHVCNDQK
jgi:hypothetical protein